MSTTIVIGVDGSVPASRAVEWVAQYAPRLAADVIAVHAVELPIYGALVVGYVPVPAPTPESLAELHDIATEWCAALTKADVAFKVEIVEGSAAGAIMQVAEREEADLVVTGRRGRGGFAELVLGSTSHQLSHCLDRPLVIVP